MTTNPTAAEALGEMIPFTFDGDDYLVQPSSEWSWDAMEAYENGRILAFLSEILDDESFAKIRAAKPKAGVLGKFVLAMQKATGIAGN